MKVVIEMVNRFKTINESATLFDDFNTGLLSLKKLSHGIGRVG